MCIRDSSLGEFLALAVSLEHLSEKYDNPKAAILGQTLNGATTQYLLNNKSPSRKVNELDNRGSHFYLALYWAESLATQDQDVELKTRFAPLVEALTANESKIVDELNTVQGMPMDIGGYYRPELKKVQDAMRPSTTLNAALAAL